MKYPSLLLLICVVLCLNLQAQKINPKSASGMALGINQADQIDNLMYVVPGIGSSSRELLEQQSLKPYMMPVRRIGSRGVDLTYAAAQCLEYYVNLSRNYKINLSPDFISLSLAVDGNDLSYQQTLDFLATTGTVTAAIVPYDAVQLTGAAFSTQKYSIINYLHIFTRLTRDRQRVFEAKKALMKGNPVLVELEVNAPLESHIGTRWLKGAKPGNKKYPLILVGYDENEEAFELMSYWGTAWGKNGYIWIKYDDFGKVATNAFVLLPKETYQ